LRKIPPDSSGGPRAAKSFLVRFREDVIAPSCDGFPVLTDRISGFHLRLKPQAHARCTPSLSLARMLLRRSDLAAQRESF